MSAQAELFPDIPVYLDRRQETSMQKPLVYSYTMLNTADNCLHKAYRQYVKKDLKFVETPEMKFGNEVHSAMEYRIGGKPLPESMRHWEPLVAVYAERKAIPEMKLGITREGKPTGFFDKDVFFRGKADVVLRNGQAAFLGDWKTGSSKYENPFELECQAVGVHAAMPNLRKIAGHYIWLKENRTGEVYDLTDTRSAWAKINNKVEVIEDNMKSGEWPKNKNPLCGWCPVLDCENNPKRTA
jgi:hypothetical protein